MSEWTPLRAAPQSARGCDLHLSTFSLASCFAGISRHGAFSNANVSRLASQLPYLCASSAVLGTLLLAAFSASTSLRAAEHTLMPSPQTVHIGYFLANVKPVLSIDSGDIVTIETAAAIVPDVVDQSGVVPPSAVPQYQRDIYGNVKDRGPGPHVLTGPIEIKGAQPGDVLEVRILDIESRARLGLQPPAPLHRRAAGGVHRALDAHHSDQPAEEDRGSREGRGRAGR